jgi:hypothetical protein
MDLHNLKEEIVKIVFKCVIIKKESGPANAIVRAHSGPLRPFYQLDLTMNSEYLIIKPYITYYRS